MPPLNGNAVYFRFADLARQAASDLEQLNEGVPPHAIDLPPGRYQYKFVIDQNNWKEDPNNPNRTNDGYGGNNSVLDVR